MSEQLICPRCGTPNAPTATSCYYCGWAPSVNNQQGGSNQPGGDDPLGPAVGGYGAGSAAGSPNAGPQNSGAPNGDAGDTGPHGFGDTHGPTFAGAYAAGELGGGQDAAASGDYGSGGYGADGYGADGYGAGGYGAGGYGAGGYDAAAGYGAGGGYSGGPGGTQVRGNAGGQPPTGGAAAAGAGDSPDRNKLLMIGAGVVGGLVVIALIVFVIIRFVVPGGGGTITDPGPAPSQGQPSTGPGTSSKSPATGKSTSPAAPTPDYDKIAGQVKSGVLKVYATACGSDGTRIGSAFLIDNDTAVASYASLAGAQVIVVATGSGLVSAAVSSVDVDHGIVILKLNRSVDGHVFDIDTSTAKSGDPVGLLGVSAKGSSPKVQTTKITGSAQTARVGNTKITGLSGTSLESDDGWSGAPSLSADGDANGVAIAGPGAAQVLIVPGTAVKQAESSGEDLPGGTCDDPHGPAITKIGGSPTRAVQKTLQRYFEGINSGDYRKAYKQLGPHSNSGPFSDYVNGWRSAYDFNIDVKSVTGSGDGTHAQVSFNSITLPGQGPKGHSEATCARWDMNYTFAADGNRLLIDRVTATPSLC